MTIEFVLEDEDLDVHYASDGEEALDLARKVKPHLMVVDQMMPKMDGRAVVEALKQMDETKEIPIVILSGVARGQDEDWHGADFLGKPFSPDELVKLIKDHLETT